jgi:hypothetical protein
MPAELVDKASSKMFGAGAIACPPKAANGSGPVVVLLAGPDQHACAVFVSNMMKGFVLLLAVNRGLL